jgi:hypothetical protein
MRGRLNFASMIALLTASSLSAQGLVPMAIQQVIDMQHNPGKPRRWVYDTNADYALWDASSKTPAGGEIAVAGKSAVIDQAPLFPQALYSTDRDLIADDKVWLPKGGLLVKMVGGEDGGNWFCTWRYDKVALASEAQFPKDERELCLQTDGSNHTVRNRLEFSFYPALLTILPSVREKKIDNLNSVTLHETLPDTLPSRISLKIFAETRNRNGKEICLNGRLEAILAVKEQCFAEVGESIDYGGGRYTLIAKGQDGSFKIRIDRPLSIHGLAPERR